MPSKSPAQHRLMEAAAHTPGGYDGVPQAVGKEFVAADQVKKPTAPGSLPHHGRGRAGHQVMRRSGDA